MWVEELDMFAAAAMSNVRVINGGVIVLHKRLRWENVPFFLFPSFSLVVFFF